jgi:hypothetical protein
VLFEPQRSLSRGSEEGAIGHCHHRAWLLDGNDGNRLEGFEVPHEESLVTKHRKSPP